MLRLKANKTSLYKLVKHYDTSVGAFRKAEFSKAPRVPDYILKWRDGDMRCCAFLRACIGRPLLTIQKKDFDGKISNTVRTIDMADLRERGMVEEFATAAERRRDKITAGGADNGGMSPAT